MLIFVSSHVTRSKSEPLEQNDDFFPGLNLVAGELIQRKPNFMEWKLMKSKILQLSIFYLVPTTNSDTMHSDFLRIFLTNETFKTCFCGSNFFVKVWISNFGISCLIRQVRYSIAMFCLSECLLGRFFASLV